MTTATNAAAKSFEQIMKEVEVYRNRENAFSALGHVVGGGHGIMLGDNRQYWLSTLANCARLEIMGYEFAE